MVPIPDFGAIDSDQFHGASLSWILDRVAQLNRSSRADCAGMVKLIGHLESVAVGIRRGYDRSTGRTVLCARARKDDAVPSFNGHCAGAAIALDLDPARITQSPSDIV